MATFTWAAYIGAGPSWTDIGANTMVLSGVGGLATAITVGAWQDETHIGNNDPGTDQCGANHANNNKYLTGTTISINGGGSEALNDTNLTQDECALRIQFSDPASVAISGARLYLFDGTTVTTEAPALDAFAFEQGVSATAWTEINNASGGTGGDNAGERLDLANQGAATDHFYFLALSVSPESVGGKTLADLGINLTYS